MIRRPPRSTRTYHTLSLHDALPSFTAYHTSFQVDEKRLDDNGGGPVGEVLERNVDTAGLRIDNRSRLALGDSTDLTFTYGGEAYTDEQDGAADGAERSEEHTSELQSLMRNSYAVFCLKKKNK